MVGIHQLPVKIMIKCSYFNSIQREKAKLNNTINYKSVHIELDTTKGYYAYIANVTDYTL